MADAPHPKRNPPPSTRPTFHGDQLREAFRTYNRDPFHDLAARLYEDFMSLDDASRQAWVRKKPDAAIAAMISVARLAGFTEKQEVLHTHALDMSKMSDSQLADRIRQKMTLLAQQGQVIDLNVVEDAALELSPHSPSPAPPDK